jgi:uncharacterized protein involved in tolerance to divalent cations
MQQENYRSFVHTSAALKPVTAVHPYNLPNFYILQIPQSSETMSQLTGKTFLDFGEIGCSDS